MPKRGNTKSFNFIVETKNENRRESYFQHDDRKVTFQEQSSSGFRRSGGSGRIQKHNSRSYSHLNDHDIEMSDGTPGGSDRRFTPYFKQRRGGNRNFNGRRGKSNSMPALAIRNAVSQTSYQNIPWQKIVAKNGTCVSKEYLMEQLKTQMDLKEFFPIAYSIENQDVVFYTDDRSVISQLRKITHFVIVQNGERISFLRKSAPPPDTILTPEIIQIMKEVMSSKYNKVMEELDLSSFYKSPRLSELAFCPLNRPVTVEAVLDIIESHIPTLQSINLSGNRIGNLEFFRPLAAKAPNLKKIDLSGNFVHEVRHLDAFSALNIEHLVLGDNPLKARVQSRTHLESAVRKIFPGIQTLDGKPMKRAIGFDIGEPGGKVPSAKGSYFSSKTVRDVAMQFLEQYLNLQDEADTKSRQMLMAAYHENATFSMESCGLPHAAQCDVHRMSLQQNVPTLGHYFQDSRNLLKVTDPKRRWKQLRQGKMAIAMYLSEMPATHHDRTSLVLDAHDVSPSLMICSLSGIFREVVPNKPVSQHAIRAFHRTFAIVPMGSGYCIINDMYFISNPTAKQVRNSFASEKRLPAPPAPQVPQQVPVQPPAEPSPAAKEQMVAAFAENSGMNMAFSRRCLEDNSWDFDRSARIFSQLNNEGKIPPDAFVK